MGWNNIKSTKNDIAFSNLVREMANWRCQKCGKLCKINGEWRAKLDASHYIGRRKHSVRFDLENVYSLCAGCHKRMGGYKREENGEYDLWVKEILGGQRYRGLIIRANTSNPLMKDEKIVSWYIKDLRKKYEQSINPTLGEI